MNRIKNNESGFSAVEIVMVVVIVSLIGAVGFLVYKDNHKKTVVVTKTVVVAPKPATINTNSNNTQKYINITEWDVRVPYQGSDTLTVSNQTCDQPGDTVLGGCSIEVDSKDLANSVGNCQSTKATGKVGHFYQMGANDDYIATNGSGSTPIAQWVSQNPGKYTKLGSYYYAFAEIGAAWGGTGTAVIKTSTNALADTTPTGCTNWIAKYNGIEPSISALASKFEAIPN